MSRSKWKRQFVSNHIIKLTKKKNTLKRPVKIYSRNSVIPASFIGKSILIHFGKDFKKVLINKKHVGFKFGEFAFTRKFSTKEKKKKKKK